MRGRGKHSCHFFGDEFPTNWLQERENGSKNEVGITLEGRLVGYHVSSSLSGQADISFRACYGRLKLTVRHHKFNQDSCSVGQECVDVTDPQARADMITFSSASSLLLSSLEMSDITIYEP